MAQLKLQALPVEVLSLIAANCPTLCLVQLCRTSQLLQTVTETILYRQVDLRRLRQCVLCFRTLLARPDLASTIRDFLVMFDSVAHILPVFWITLGKVLTLTRNLTSLHFAAQGPSSLVFRHCTFPRLRILSSVVYLSTELGDFLARHPSIKQLCLGGPTNNDRLSLSPASLPALETYLGSRSLARDVVPGRPVVQVTLAWTSHMSEVDISDTIRTLAMGTVPLRHFGCTTFGADPNRSIIEALAAHLPRLHTIRLNNFSGRGPVDDDFVAAINTLLTSFKELRGLHVPAFFSPSSSAETVDEQSVAEVTIAAQWKASCPTLENITLPNCNEWRFSRQERCWKRREGNGERAILGFGSLRGDLD